LTLLRGAESKGARPRLFWKIDYYDLDLERLSTNPANPSKGSKLFAPLSGPQAPCVKDAVEHHFRLHEEFVRQFLALNRITIRMELATKGPASINHEP